MNKSLKQIFSIILLSFFIGLIRFLFLDEYTLFPSKESKEEISVINSEIEDFLGNINEPEIINLGLAKEIYDENLAIFIDARDYEDFVEGHISNSINIPYNENDAYDEVLLDSLFDTYKPLVIYCSGEGCSLSEDLTYYLYENKNIYSILYFEEGYPGWADNDYPIKLTEVIESDIDDFEYLDILDYLILMLFIFIAFTYKNDKYHYFIITISRLFLGFIFIYFSYDKIIDPHLFLKMVRNYDILPFSLESIGALVLPILEFLIGILLILGIFINASINISISLLILFILMIGQAYLRGKSIDCGCNLSDLSQNVLQDKRFYMIKRIIQDICFLVFAVILKYRDRFEVKND